MYQTKKKKTEKEKREILNINCFMHISIYS